MKIKQITKRQISNAAMNKKSLKDVFEENRSHLLYQIKKYLSKNKENKSRIDFDSSRKCIAKYISKENIGKAITLLEDLKEYKQGIITNKLLVPHFPLIVIRDARNCKLKKIRGSESFEIQYLNLIRGSLDIIDIERKKDLYPKIIMNAVNFISHFHTHNFNKSQEDMRRNFRNALYDLVLFLEHAGIENAINKLDISKDFQNFNDVHADVVTINTMRGSNRNYIVFEAEVALRGLTKNQMEEYTRILESNNNEPEWYKVLPKWEQELCRKYAHKILQGTHIISCQLRQIVGMRNTFEKITGIINDTTSELEILHKSKHSGCLASFSRHENSRQYIANLNAEQAQEWIGFDVTLHCNTFNSGPNTGKESDKIIVSQTIKAMEHIKGRVTNTAFDSFRKYSGANFYNGANYLIDKLSNFFNKSKHLNYVTYYLKSQNEKDKYITKNKIKEYVKLLHNNNNIGIKAYKILNILIDLKDKIKKSEKGSPGFLNMEISTNLNVLQHIINNIVLTGDFKGINKKEFPKEEILNMCALGLDRTGFSQHIQSIKSLESIVLKQVTYLDSEIIAGGHTSQIAGATYFGGGSIGCYGIKEDSKVYFPKKRAKALSGLLELSASGNKLVSC
jgi:hypothetical protein